MAKDKEFTDESAAAVEQKPRGSDAAEPNGDRPRRKHYAARLLDLAGGKGRNR